MGEIARLIGKDELRLLRALIARVESSVEVDDVSQMRVVELPDGGMGSLRFEGKAEAIFGREVAELELEDTDGVIVSVTLNVDMEGGLFEIDIFKTDFSPLRTIPETFN